MKKVFVDGNYGVAGYSLMEKLKPIIESGEIQLLSLPQEMSKEKTARYQAIEEADIAVLCLPEDVVRETCSDLKDCSTIIIDASIEHRTSEGWAYAYPELNDYQKNRILNSKRISNPGCFANGMLTILNPIKGYLKQDVPLTLIGVTGYSAGGKQTIQKQMESPLGYRVTNLNREHIHVKEVKHWLKIKNPVAFMPSVASFERGQMVSLNLFQENLRVSLSQIQAIFEDFYQGSKSVKVLNSTSSVLIPEKMAGRDDVEIYLAKPSEDYLQIHAVYDNLGRGSSGSIVHIIKDFLKQ